MHQFFVDPEQIQEDRITVTGDEVNHIRNVLRIRCGEEIEISDGQMRTYHCKVTDVTGSSVTAEIMWEQKKDTELPCRITLFQGLPKSDKMDLIVQKSVELGASEIVPMMTERSVIKLDEKRAVEKVRRWNTVAKNSAEQSLRSIVPLVLPVMSFDKAVDYAAACNQKFIPYERARGIRRTREAFERIKPGDSVALFIGPEGGFDREEIDLATEAGILPISLGSRILRTETAGMSVLSILMYLLEEDSLPDESL